MVKKETGSCEEIFFIIFMIIISLVTFGGAFLVWWFIKMAVKYGVESARE